MGYECCVVLCRHVSRYSKVGARLPAGVLLIGPPGTGKLARWLAHWLAGSLASASWLVDSWCNRNHSLKTPPIPFLVLRSLFPVLCLTLTLPTRPTSHLHSLTQSQSSRQSSSPSHFLSVLPLSTQRTEKQTCIGVVPAAATPLTLSLCRIRCHNRKDITGPCDCCGG